MGRLSPKEVPMVICGDYISLSLAVLEVKDNYIKRRLTIYDQEYLASIYLCILLIGSL